MYELIQTASGWAVRRRDGNIAEFIDRSEAERALKLLVDFNEDESEYEWRAI